jgi:hypothetical protein
MYPPDFPVVPAFQKNNSGFLPGEQLVPREIFSLRDYPKFLWIEKGDLPAVVY